MVQVTARLPDDLSAELDVAAGQLKRSRADVIRQAIEYYLDDSDGDEDEDLDYSSENYDYDED